jgi:hypothetical protein
VLRSLDALVKRHSLHHPKGEPVSLLPVIEEYQAGYKTLPHQVLAVTGVWQQGNKRMARIAYDHALREITASARKRHADAHEFAHILLRHEGTEFILWDRTSKVDQCNGFSNYVLSKEESECESVAAFLLVPLLALVEWRHMNSWWIARRLDVPEHLVDLRWTIWRKFGR